MLCVIYTVSFSIYDSVTPLIKYYMNSLCYNNINTAGVKMYVCVRAHMTFSKMKVPTKAWWREMTIMTHAHFPHKN